MNIETIHIERKILIEPIRIVTVITLIDNITMTHVEGQANIDLIGPTVQTGIIEIGAITHLISIIGVTMIIKVEAQKNTLDHPAMIESKITMSTYDMKYLINKTMIVTDEESVPMTEI